MAVKTANTSTTASGNLTDVITKGTVAGLVGGTIFGVQMTVAGMLPMVADMIGSSSIVVGYILHMLISAFIGATFALLADRLPATLPTWPTAVGAGAVWGIVWWVLGALIIMPTVLGMGEMVLEVGDPQLNSLAGHISFGIVTAAFYVLIRDRS